VDFRLASSISHPAVSDEEKTWWFVRGFPLPGVDPFAAVRVVWREVEHSFVAGDLNRVLSTGSRLILPDLYFMPWHPQYLRKHIWVHTLFAQKICDETLWLLDSDAELSQGCLRTVRVSAFHEGMILRRVGEIQDIAGWENLWDSTFRTALTGSVQNLAESIPAWEKRLSAWKEKFEEDFYSPFHISLINLLQSKVFVFHYIAKHDKAVGDILDPRPLEQFLAFLIRSHRRLTRAGRHHERTGEPMHHREAGVVLEEGVLELRRLSTTFGDALTRCF
jgi:hypothetical protein